jgi:alpha-methylacyl-CoA racemase
VKVLDLTRLVPGPFASLVLSDLGATVDRLDDPDAPDYLRFVTPLEREGESARFAALNRGKRSLALRLRTPQGRVVLHRLLDHYDVLLEQFRPGVLEKLIGISFESLQRAHPKLIVCSITGFGQTGPDAGRAGHDLTYAARAGMLGGGRSETLPAVPAAQNADILGALYAVIAIQGALRAREHTQQGEGGGTHLDISMTEAALTSLAFALGDRSNVDPTQTTLTGGLAAYRTYRTRDRRAIALAALEPKFWNKLNALFGFETSMEDAIPGPHQQQLMQRWETVFASRTWAEWREFSQAHDVCIEPILELSEVRADKHLNERAVLSAGGGFRTPASVHMPEDVAHCGANTEEILREAGLSGVEIDRVTTET